MLENQENALKWYHRAVALDPYMHEALDRLVGSHLLPFDKVFFYEIIFTNRNYFYKICQRFIEICRKNIRKWHC